MSKNFEEEYKEYLNAQAPDLWDRIEEGIDATGKVVPISDGRSKKAKKKRRIRYQHYRTLVTAVACLFVLILLVPVYLLVKPVGMSKNETAADSAAPIVLTDATIENIEVQQEETTAAAGESAPEEEVEETVVELPEETVELNLEEVQQTEMEAQQEIDELPEEGTAEEMTELAGATDGDKVLIFDGNGILAKEELTEENTVEEPAEENAAEEPAEEAVPAQEDMEVSILSEGEQNESGMIYGAVIAGSASSAMITLVVPPDSSIAFEKERRYLVTVSQAADGSYVVASANLIE